MTAVWVVFKAVFIFRLGEGFQKSGLGDFFSLLLDILSPFLFFLFFFNTVLIIIMWSKF